MPQHAARAINRARLLAVAALALMVLGAHLWLLDQPVPTASAPSTAGAPPRAAAVTTTVRAVAPPAAPAADARAAARADPAAAPAVRSATSATSAPVLRREPVSRRPVAPAAAASSTRPITAAAPAQEPVPPPPPDAFTRSVPGTKACAPLSLAQLPPPLLVRYSLKRGRLQGEGVLDWRWEAGRYSLRLEGQVPLVGTLLLQRSEGGFDPCGLAPLRHTERRLGRSERAVSFVRHVAGDAASAEADELRFSNNASPRPLLAGTQDRLSWLVQLATRLGGWPGGSPPDGEHLALDVAAVGGDVQHWVFTVVGQDERGWLHLRREADDPFGTRADVWTDPQHQHWPVRVELREARGDPLVLQLTNWQPTAR